MWDTEIWMLPNVLLMNPAWSEQMLHYRFQRLGAAMAHANETGYMGARYVLNYLVRTSVHYNREPQCHVVCFEYCTDSHGKAQAQDVKSRNPVVHALLSNNFISAPTLHLPFVIISRLPTMSNGYAVKDVRWPQRLQHFGPIVFSTIVQVVSSISKVNYIIIGFYVCAIC